MTTDDTSAQSFGEVTERDDADNVQDSEVTTEAGGEVKTEPTATDTSGEKPAETTEPQLTEKGTKLDPNPQSAVHQQLANERRVRQQMEQVLNNPQLLARYMQQQFGGVPKMEDKPIVETKTYKAEDFENLDDVAGVVNNIQSTFAEKIKDYESKIEQLSGTVRTLVDGGRQQQVATNIERDVASLQGEKELNPKDPDFIPGLENEIVALYHQLDFDEQSGTYRGNYSMAQIGQRIVEAARKARSAGSLKAQTVIKDKSEGKVRTSPSVDVDADSENESPETSIAKGISKLFR